MPSHPDPSCRKAWNDGVVHIPQSASIGPLEPIGHVWMRKEGGTEQVFIRCIKCVQEFEDDEDFAQHYTLTHSLLFKTGE
jgi:uncharacterized C2H2 Zn-finger protein